MQSAQWLSRHAPRLEHYLADRVLSLVCRLPHRVAVLGIASLVELKDRLFLVTARHVAQALQSAAGHGALAVRERHGPGLIPLPATLAWACPPDHSDALDADVCALALEPALAGRLRRIWTPLTGASFAEAGALAQRPEAAYLIAGYPAAETGGALLTVYTRRLSSAPAAALAPVHPRFDWFFEYARRASDFATGQAKRTPELEGVSGAPVWSILQTSGPDWSPERGLCVVGVQTSYLHSSFIRAKDWSLVSPLLGQA